MFDFFREIKKKKNPKKTINQIFHYFFVCIFLIQPEIVSYNITYNQILSYTFIYYITWLNIRKRTIDMASTRLS